MWHFFGKDRENSVIDLSNLTVIDDHGKQTLSENQWNKMDYPISVTQTRNILIIYFLNFNGSAVQMLNRTVRTPEPFNPPLKRRENEKYSSYGLTMLPGNGPQVH
ncbi:hypothetical protein AVEN_1764-1 [Araneus ventricosus]|uniref:Uncharacterized protein n=1 Tax=Araneus ventricosus TaxID=182803 RepID=A0A4Y2SDI5_ARAVE|nr:hypothetical protein AVEN_1764-1 [Araneus ventricosus]